MKMTNKDFIAFRAYMGWTIEKTANVLGKSTRTIIRYEQNAEIPPSIAMSCAYTVMRHVNKNGVKRIMSEYKTLLKIEQNAKEHQAKKQNRT